MSSDLAVLVVGYARPALLRNVLESLHRQGATSLTHVWLDGTAGRMELRADVAGCVEVARGYPVRELREHAGHLGIEKLMLDALRTLAETYDRMIVLEDDTFPTAVAISTFSAALEQVAADESVFSVYGHPFGLEPPDGRFPRFHGWGWATTRTKLLPVLGCVRDLFLLDEASYLASFRAALTPEVVARLSVTPTRNVSRSQFFSWDSATAFVCAQRGLLHQMTPRRVIFNCGLTPGHGHFTDQALFRAPPFNMIAPHEVWSVFGS